MAAAGTAHREFERLARELDTGTCFDSTGRTMRDHPARAAIVRMGEEAVPLILERMGAGLLHWHGTLAEITGEDPVPRESWGKIKKEDNKHGPTLRKP